MNIRLLIKLNEYDECKKSWFEKSNQLFLLLYIVYFIETLLHPQIYTH